VGWYIPISIKDSKLHESFSIRNLPGVIFLSDSPAPLVLAEAIIHEYHHQLLFLQSAAHDLLIGGDEAAYYSPWRDDARPLEMLLHALYVFTGVVGFLRRIEDIPGIDMGVARGRREYIAHQLQLGFLQLPMDRLTDAGRALVAVVQAAANRHTADLNLKSSKRPARVIDHLERWRAAHPHLRPTEVGQGGIPS
jgi:HEXXH motif-containing protein